MCHHQGGAASPYTFAGTLYDATGATLTLIGSTLSGNTAAFAGGIYDLGTTLTVTFLAGVVVAIVWVFFVVVVAALSEGS